MFKVLWNKHHTTSRRRTDSSSNKVFVGVREKTDDELCFD